MSFVDTRLPAVRRLVQARDFVSAKLPGALPVAAALAASGVVLFELLAIARLLSAGITVHSAPPAAVVSQQVAEDSAALRDAHLFGTAAPPASSTPAAPAAPDTALELNLRGVLRGRDGTRAQAIISGSDGEQRIYGVGDGIAGSGATLVTVDGDRVVLRVAGELEALRFERRADAAVAPASDAVALEAVAAAAPAPVEPVAPEVVAENRARLRNVLRLTPDVRDGKVVGFRVLPGRERRAFDSFGLLVSDVITAVDGEQLVDAAHGAEMLASLSQAPSVSLTVLRDGVSQNLTLRLGDLGPAP